MTQETNRFRFLCESLIPSHTSGFGITQWQARFRQWYERELQRHQSMSADDLLDPQRLQIEFPQYEELKKDLERVNRALIRYRAKMHELVLKE